MWINNRLSLNLHSALFKNCFMAKVQGAIEVNEFTCKGCSLCVEACPTDVIRLAKEVNAKGYNFAYMFDPEACNGCSNCAMVCPDSCITVYRVKLTETA